MSSLNSDLIRRPEFISALQQMAETTVFKCMGCAGQDHVQGPYVRSFP